MGAVQHDMAWLAVLGLIGSAISAYFYLRVVMVMYMKEPSGETQLVPSGGVVMALAITIVAVLGFGIFPSPLLDYTQEAVLQISNAMAVATP